MRLRVTQNSSALPFLPPTRSGSEPTQNSRIHTHTRHVPARATCRHTPRHHPRRPRGSGREPGLYSLSFRARVRLGVFGCTWCFLPSYLGVTGFRTKEDKVARLHSLMADYGSAWAHLTDVGPCTSQAVCPIRPPPPPQVFNHVNRVKHCQPHTHAHTHSHTCVLHTHTHTIAGNCQGLASRRRSP